MSHSFSIGEISAAFKEALAADPSMAMDVLNAVPEQVLRQKLHQVISYPEIPRCAVFGGAPFCVLVPELRVEFRVRFLLSPDWSQASI